MSAPRALQPSFAKGEITPLLYTRIDLQAYVISLAYLLNMIVLPQGGITRRPGFERLGDARKTTGGTCPIRLIPFVYNRADAMVIELSDGWARIWRPSTGAFVADIVSPYAESELDEVKFVQSGNVIFMTHRNHPVQMLRRNTLTNWVFESMEFRNGPWLPDSGGEGVTMRVGNYNTAAGIYNIHASEDYFTADMVGSLIELNYTVPRNDIEGESLMAPDEYVSEAIEVGGQWHIQTFDGWRGEIEVEKSYDGGDTWITELNYARNDPSSQGQLDVSRAESEANVLYRVKASHDAGTNTPIRFTFTASGFTKTNIFRITEYLRGTLVRGEWQKDPDEVNSIPIVIDTTSDWRLGAWGGVNGYPGAVEFYQDRLALGGSNGQPQTLWMSRTGDYSDFGTSLVIQDDDAINVTLSASDMDGIQSLVALDDLIIFTASDEWRLTGAGDNGAITPTAVVAHKQASEVGSSYIQPLVITNGIVFVQTHRTEVHALGYDLSSDGYVGSEISVFSSHLFQWLRSQGGSVAGRAIRKMAYQKVPDKLLWFVLDDGTAVSCTFQSEHGMNAWARHETNGRFGDFVCIPRDGYDELWAAVQRGGRWGIERMAPRAKEARFNDDGYSYESCARTLRVNYDGGGSTLSVKKLFARCTVYTIRSTGAMISPASDRQRAKPISWEWSPEMAESDIMLDNGFRKDAALEIWVDDDRPLTITGISPSVTPGG